jgi:CBS domain-containing protein
MQQCTVADFMTAAPHAIEPHEPLATARDRMRETRAQHPPVRTGGIAVGILSDRDVAVLVAAKFDLRKTGVADVMTPDPYCVRPETPLATVAKEVAAAKIGSALVVDAKGVLVGTFTVTDGMRALSTLA